MAFFGGSTSITVGATTLSGGTSGSVLFVGASSELQQDNANFFWDDTNNRFGIGTTSPTAKVHIVAGTLATAVSAFYVSGTLANAVGTQVGTDFQITTAGTSPSSIYGMRVNVLAGYTGAGYSYAANFSTTAAGTGADWVTGAANIVCLQQSYATTTGDNVGCWARANGGGVNIGVAGSAVTAKNGATNIGVIGLGLNTGTTPVQ